MTTTDQTLINRALEAQKRAYAPYSKYPVGCALAANGRVYEGANVENASYGLSVCAERIACANAAIGGVRDIETIVIVTPSSPPAGPCGACLQTLREFCKNPQALRIILVNSHGQRQEHTLQEFIPFAFHKQQLTPSS